MKQAAQAPYCLATISSREFCIATEVLLYSFMKYNPWFEGDLVVIGDDLTADLEARLNRRHPVRLHRPDPRLKAAAQSLSSLLPDEPAVYRRFYTFEVFRLAGYERVLYLDSDICCTGDVAPLFTAQAPLLACPDGFTYADRILDCLAEAEGRQHRPLERYGRRFARSFNAGVLSIAAELLGEATYEDLLAMLDGEGWRALGPSKFTDQMALNLQFADRFTALSGIYNFMIFIEAYQKAWDEFGFADARLLHFAGTIKPWNDYAPGDLLKRAPQFIKFFDVWRELLQEARASAPRAALAESYRQQKDWIDAYNRSPLKPIGRLD
jgi:lipopolysaccharide biosynthesis glycosyltransferase